MRASEAAVSRRGSHAATFLPARRIVAVLQQPLHLFELVADVQDRPSFVPEPVEHDEKLLRLLRRQDGGRLVEDQQLWILHERAHDLDALALADRQLPDFAIGIAAAARRRARSLRASPTMAANDSVDAQAERDVLGDGEVLEQ